MSKLITVETGAMPRVNAFMETKISGIYAAGDVAVQARAEGSGRYTHAGDDITIGLVAVDAGIMSGAGKPTLGRLCHG